VNIYSHVGCSQPHLQVLDGGVAPVQVAGAVGDVDVCVVVEVSGAVGQPRVAKRVARTHGRSLRPLLGDGAKGIV